MSITIDGVTVRFGRDPDNYKRTLITVQVASRVKDGLKASSDLDPGRFTGVQPLIAAVMDAAATQAEYLGTKYCDNVDPEQAAKNAAQALREEIRLMDELSRDIPGKLRRLKDHKNGFTRNELEALARIDFLVQKAEKLLPSEVQWINNKIAAVHEQQL